MTRKKLSDSQRFDILERDGFLCHYCGAAAPEVRLEVDHITPVAKGGTNSYDNLVTACERCNGGKAARPLAKEPELLWFRRAYDELSDKAAHNMAAWVGSEFGRQAAPITLGDARRLANLDARRVRSLFDEVKVWAVINEADDAEVWPHLVERLTAIAAEQRKAANA